MCLTSVALVSDIPESSDSASKKGKDLVISYGALYVVLIQENDEKSLYGNSFLEEHFYHEAMENVDFLGFVLQFLRKGH